MRVSGFGDRGVDVEAAGTVEQFQAVSAPLPSAFRLHDTALRFRWKPLPVPARAVQRWVATVTAMA